MIISLDNIGDSVKISNPIIKQRIIKYSDRWKQYRLYGDVCIKLSNDNIIFIQAGFEWDLSSSPRLLWSIFPPDGDFEIAALIHDYLYRNKPAWSTRYFADKEMLLWSNKVNAKKFDNYIRFLGVRLFGWIIWRK